MSNNQAQNPQNQIKISTDEWKKHCRSLVSSMLIIGIIVAFLFRHWGR